jgi:hypothetical protein
MKDLSEIIETLKKFRGLKSDKEVAELLGINPRTFETDKFRGKIPYKELIAFCEQYKVSMDWLVLGIGEPFVHGDQAKETPSNSLFPAELVRIFEKVDESHKKMIVEYAIDVQRFFDSHKLDVLKPFFKKNKA